MATVAEAIHYRLTHTTAITNLCSTRGYAYGEAPTSATFPFWTYRRINNKAVNSVSESLGLYNARYQIDCVSDGIVSAEALADAIRANLNAVAGSIGNPSNACTVRNITHDDDADDFTPPADASETGAHVVPLVFSIWHR